jgi:hypothetical protein
VLNGGVEDISEARPITAEQAEVLDLLELNPDHRDHVRLTLAQWRQVDRVVDRLFRERDRPVARSRSASSW